LCLLPAVWLAYDAATGGLGANPIEAVLHRTGWWTLVFLLVTLSITPLRRVAGWNRIVRNRRTVGLFAFAWASAHLLGYVVLDQWFAWSYIAEDIAERPFILVGFAAWVLLVPLAVTSTTGWIRRLGKRWRRLHRLVYAAAALGTLHFYWRIRADAREPLIFAGILAILLLVRIPSIQNRLPRWRSTPRQERSGGPTAARRHSDRIPAPGP
jgi:sulfoxide reductase heme-binding subunit YedZ